MKRIILCLRDRKAEQFMNPFYVPTLGVAYRDLSDETRRAAADNPLFSHASDFDVYQLGVFDSETGNIDSLGEPHLVVNVSSLVMDPSGNDREVVRTGSGFPQEDGLHPARKYPAG